MAPSKVEHALLKLPAAAWPYGRVVSMSDIGIVENETDIILVDKNRDAALAILKKLDVAVWRYPT